MIPGISYLATTRAREALHGANQDEGGPVERHTDRKEVELGAEEILSIVKASEKAGRTHRLLRLRCS